MTAVQFHLEQPELEFTASGGSTVRRTVLPCGVRVLTETMASAQSASVSFSVAVGSRDETNGHFGSTHFLEHLLFKGTKTRSALDIAVAFDSVGGASNALTGKEHTSYYARVQDSAIPVAVEVIADMLASSVIDEKEFENERTVILEELAMNDDDPQDVAHEEFFSSVLAGHPLGRPIGGTPETINAVDRAAVWDHYKANYRPQDLVITSAGGVDHDELLQLVTENLDLAGWNLAVPSTPRAWRNQVLEPTKAEPTVKVMNRPIAQANIIFGNPGIVASDERRYAMAILNTVLGGGMSSRLFQEIREKRGLAYSVYSFNQGYSDGAVFGLYAGCSPAKAAEVTKLMLLELEKVANEGISLAELELAQGNISGGLALKFEGTQARMSRLSSAELTDGLFYDLDESLSNFAAVTLQQVQEVASAMFQQKHSFVAVGDVADDLFDKFI